MHMKGEPMTGKENREIKNSVFVDLFYEDESAEANECRSLPDKRREKSEQ